MLLYLSRFSYAPETWAKLIGNPDARWVGRRMEGTEDATTFRGAAIVPTP